MGWRFGWRRKLPGGYWVSWSQRLGGSRRRRAAAGGGGCGLLLLCLCLGTLCISTVNGVLGDPMGRNLRLTVTARAAQTTTPLPTLTETKAAKPTDTVAVTSQPTASLQPTETVAPSFQLVELTTPVQAGGKATLTIQTEAGAACSIAYITPSGNISTADGLEPKIADNSGLCSWTWAIGPQTTPGTGSIAVTVNEATQRFEIEVQ